MQSNKVRLAIFGSGGGSNAESIIQHFQNHDTIEVALIVCNRKKAYLLERAKNHQIESLYITKDDIYGSDQLIDGLRQQKIDYIILAGFLLLIPSNLVEAFPNKIINIHPALLPKYGGKGMYGKYVHQAVKEAKETVSGMTIHYVNEAYDEGAIIAQYQTEISVDDSAEVIGKKVLRLEHQYYASTIEKEIISGLQQPHKD